MVAIIEFGQRRLDRPVAAIDHQQLGFDAGDGFHRIANLLGTLDLVMKHIGMLGAERADPRQLRNIAR